MDPLLTAGELIAAYSQGTLSPVEATQASLAAIERRDGEINSFCLVDGDRAVEQAKASEERWRAGNPIGWLDGVPTSIKDVFLTEGWPTHRGSVAAPPDPGEVDAPVVARMREAGLIFLGKTTTPELGWKATTHNRLTGITRNPWDPTKTSGGSSGGSAAALAAGMGELSVGTDAGGSVRIPASFCGVVGFKPTFGRIPHYPASPFGALAHSGPMARSVEDCALLLDVLAMGDYRDPTALAPLQGSYREAVRRDVRGLRAAYSPTLGYIDVDPEIADVALAAVHALEEAGLQVTETDPGFEDPAETFEVLWATGAASWVSTFPDGSMDKLDPGLAAITEQGLTYSAMDWLHADKQRLHLGIDMGRFHTEYDVLITPMMPIRPFEAGHDVPPGGPYEKWWQWTRFSYPFNLTQQPALSVPVGSTSDGLPVGLQIVGPRHADDLVLAVGQLVQEVVDLPIDRPAAPQR